MWDVKCTVCELVDMTCFASFWMQRSHVMRFFFRGTLQMTRDLCIFLLFSLCRWHGSLRFLGMSDNSHVICRYYNILRCAQRSLSQLSRPAVNVQSRNCRRVWLEPVLDQIQYRPSFYALKQNHVCICTCVFRATGWIRKLAYPRRMRDPSLIFESLKINRTWTSCFVKAPLKEIKKKMCWSSDHAWTWPVKGDRRTRSQNHAADEQRVAQTF